MTTETKLKLEEFKGKIEKIKPEKKRKIAKVIQELLEVVSLDATTLTPNKKKVEVLNLVNKFEQAFSMGCNITEACLYAKVDNNAYYYLIDRYPFLKEKFTFLRSNVPMLAKSRVAEGVSESYYNAMDYLKRTQPTEYGDKSQNLNHTINEDRTIIVMSEEELADIEEPSDE